MLRSTTTYNSLRTFRFFSSRKIQAKILVDNAKIATSRLAELKEIANQLGSYEEAIKVMQNKYPGLFTTATKAEIRSNYEVLAEAAKNNPGGYL